MLCNARIFHLRYPHITKEIYRTTAITLCPYYRFFVIFPLGLGELAKPFYGQIPNANSMIMSFVFSAYMLVVGGLHVWKLKIVYNKKVL